MRDPECDTCEYHDWEEWYDKEGTGDDEWWACCTHPEAPELDRYDMKPWWWSHQTPPDWCPLRGTGG